MRWTRVWEVHFDNRVRWGRKTRRVFSGDFGSCAGEEGLATAYNSAMKNSLHNLRECWGNTNRTLLMTSLFSETLVDYSVETIPFLLFNLSRSLQIIQWVSVGTVHFFFTQFSFSSSFFFLPFFQSNSAFSVVLLYPHGRVEKNEM